MMMIFEVVCPEQDGKFSYYKMHLDPRLVGGVTQLDRGGAMVELITGQTIHVNAGSANIESDLQNTQKLSQSVSAQWTKAWKRRVSSTTG